MGLFNFWKKKQRIAPTKTSQTPRTSSPPFKPVPKETVTSKQNSSKSITTKGITIHNDLKDLVWIGDGKFKNYSNTQDSSNSFDIDGLKITVSFMNQEEPSLIYTKQRITQPKSISDVERPSYYPTYSSLTPEQKWVYLHLLANPYNPLIDIGFVFILYYGLERHLLSGNFERAIDVILKLRDVHTNKSFQSYSANAIILSCMIHQRGDLVLKFIESLDKEHELAFSDNLFLICYFSFDLPLLPKDIMRMSKTFEFTKMNYIKKYPDMFVSALKESIKRKTGKEVIDLKQYLTPGEIKGIKKQKVGIFANMSIIDKSIPIPLLSENFKLKREMYNLLEAAHEEVKSNLAEMRESGKTPPQKKTPIKEKKQLVFDKKQEKELLTELRKHKNNPVQRHFSYISLQNFYYKYRSLGDEYTNECIKYCTLDINSLAEMNKAYVDIELKRLNQFSSYGDKKKLSVEIKKIKEQGFIGNIPAFKRLVIIFDKQKAYEKAIEICNKAIEYGQSVEDFEERKQKIQKKMVK